MKIKQIVLVSLLVFFAATGLRAAASGVKTVAISGYDTMKFNVQKIEAEPGQKMVVVLTNEGSMPKETMGHNWILLDAGVNPIPYANLAVSAKASNYQPKALASKVLAAIPVLGPKETGRVAFTAPTTPGTYHFLCSFPAHASSGMVGVLIVK